MLYEACDTKYEVEDGEAIFDYTNELISALEYEVVLLKEKLEKDTLQVDSDINTKINKEDVDCCKLKEKNISLRKFIEEFDKSMENLFLWIAKANIIK